MCSDNQNLSESELEQDGFNWFSIHTVSIISIENEPMNLAFDVVFTYTSTRILIGTGFIFYSCFLVWKFIFQYDIFWNLVKKKKWSHAF